MIFTCFLAYIHTMFSFDISDQLLSVIECFVADFWCDAACTLHVNCQHFMGADNITQIFQSFAVVVCNHTPNNILLAPVLLLLLFFQTEGELCSPQRDLAHRFRGYRLYISRTLNFS